MEVNHTSIYLTEEERRARDTVGGARVVGREGDGDHSITVRNKQESLLSLLLLSISLEILCNAIKQEKLGKYSKYWQRCNH